MAWRSEKNGNQTDIVIDGFEKGIADDPYSGIADMRNVNIVSVPKEASVQFANAAVVKPPTGVSGASFSAVGATDIVTVASTAGYYNGMAIKIDSTSIALLLTYVTVGGGGGGGGNGGVGGRFGGGGGGGQVTAGTTAPTISLRTVTVGAAGAGSATATGSDGGTTSIGTLSTAVGGGGGGGQGSSGRSGASGGGGGNTSGVGGTATAGNIGGNGSATNTGAGGGGGGSGSAGTNGTGNSGAAIGGNGGNGTSNSTSGAAVFYGAGGGGGGNSAGSTGTGGNGANSGGGGDSTAGGTGNSGGAGIAIVSYPTGAVTATGGTITTVGGNTVHSFTTNGTFTITVLNLAVNGVYYVGNLSGNTFKLYTTPRLTDVVNILADTTGTYSVPSFGKPYDSCLVGTGTTEVNSGETYDVSTILDDTGNVWLLGNGTLSFTLNVLYYYGNVGHTTLTTTGSLGVGFWLGYLFVLAEDKIDYLRITNFFSSGPSNWVYGWKTITATEAGHKAIPATDDALYFCNDVSVGSILENAGTTFDPTSSATYTFNTDALTLPQYDRAKCLAQLGVTLLVGGIKTAIYPWDRISPSFSYPLIVAEGYIKNIVSTNATGYIFAGKRGRIYLTNGSNIALFKKFPDQLASTESPYFNWGGGIYLRNQLYFGISATDNAGTAINNFSGMWAIDLENGSLYLCNSLSTGSYAGSVPVLVPMGNINPAGNAVYVGWIDGSSVGGIDYATTSPYVNFESYIDTDIIPVGTYYDPNTDQQIEYKLSKPLVAGESVQVFWRGNLNDAFTQIPNLTAVAGELSGATQVNFQKQQWVQLRMKYSSTATTPSFTKLREIRMR